LFGVSSVRAPHRLRSPHPGGRTCQLLQWFVYSIVVGVFAAYIAGRALGPGASYLPGPT